MNLKDARALAREIQQKKGHSATVPLGHGPDRYFARIVTILPEDLDPKSVAESTPAHSVDFYGWEEAEEWFTKAAPVQEALNHWIEETLRRLRTPACALA